MASASGSNGETPGRGFEIFEPPHHVERAAGIAQALHTELGSDAMVEIVSFGRMATRVAVPDVGPAHATLAARDDLVADVLSGAETVVRPAGGGDHAVALGASAIFEQRIVAVVSAWFPAGVPRDEPGQLLELAARGLAGWWGSQEQRRAHAAAATLDAAEARERERRRLAYDLHGSVAQELAAARINAETAQLLAGRQHDEAGSAELVSNMQQHIEAAQAQTRRLINALSARTTEGSTLNEIAEALCREYEQKLNMRRKTGLELSVAGLPPAASAELSEAFAFVLRESLQNVYEHARAQEVLVTAAFRRGEVVLAVTDDGVGFSDPAPRDKDQHLGMSGIRERVRAVGGSLSVRSGEGTGTDVSAVFPVASR